jgi:hypothetical protein
MVAAVLAAVVASTVAQAGPRQTRPRAEPSTANAKPSIAVAKRTTRRAVIERYPLLFGNYTISIWCSRLTTVLYRCGFDADAPGTYEIFGKSKVRFYRYGVDATLYDLKCYDDEDLGLQLCAR